MGVLENLNLTIRQRAEHNYKLPDELSLYEIYDLWWTDKGDSFLLYLKSMHRAYQEKKLIGEYRQDYYIKPKPAFSLFPEIILAEEELKKMNEIIFRFSGEHGHFAFIESECRYIVVNKANFLAWLESNKHPKPTGCLLERWWLDSSIAQQIREGKNETGKKLKRIARARTESLELIYAYLKSKGLKTGDTVEISANAAWGEIVAKKFTTDLIKSITGERDQAKITFNGGEEIDKTDFVRKYNQRLSD